MNRDEYRLMHAVEASMWWYRGLHANLLTLLGRDGDLKGRLLDAGCGTGGVLHRIGLAYPRIQTVGMDIEPLAAAFAREKSGAAVCVGSLNALPFASNSLAAILSADVLCHRAVDEAAALADCHRALMPGGALVLNLPAYGWMMSAHDRAVHTVRRYTARGITRTLRAAGFERIRTTYWNMLPFPLMVVRRKLWATEGETSDVMPYPMPIERVFRGLMAIENSLLRLGLRLPFGGSVLVAATKAVP